MENRRQILDFLQLPQQIKAPISQNINTTHKPTPKTLEQHLKAVYNIYN